MPDFRDKLYDQYYNSQSGRRLNKPLSDKIKENHRQLRKEILPLLPPSRESRILDIGCGYGELLLLLKEEGYIHSQGIDISPEQVDIAHSLGLDNVAQGDVFDFLENNTGRFDCITGIDIIEHFGKDELLHLLDLIKNALSDKGIAIFRTPNMDGLLASVYAYGDFTHQCLLNSSSAIQLGISAGFAETEVLPSHIRVNGFFKELIRKLLWWQVETDTKLVLFASGRSTKGVLFTPNLLMVVRK